MTRLIPPTEITPLRVFRLHGQSFDAAPVTDLKTLLADPTAMVWVDMDGPTPYDVTVLRDVFRFHPLAIEDTLNERQRPKIEEYGDHLFGIVNAITRTASKEPEIVFREIDIFIGRNFLVTVHEGAEPCIDYALRRCVEAAALPNRVMSPSYALYTLLDKVVDDYFPILDAIGDEIDDIGEAVLEQPKQAALTRLYNLKRSLAEIWRISGQQRDMFSILNREGSIFDHTGVLGYYIRDVQDHVIRISDTVNTFRDTLSGVVDLYMSSFSNRLNVTLKRLTILTLVIGSFTLISGFYGMNFEQTWPPFESPWGVPFVIGLMLVAVIGVLLYVRQSE